MKAFINSKQIPSMRNDQLKYLFDLELLISLM